MTDLGVWWIGGQAEEERVVFDVKRRARFLGFSSPHLLISNDAGYLFLAKDWAVGGRKERRERCRGRHSDS